MTIRHVSTAITILASMAARLMAQDQVEMGRLVGLGQSLQKQGKSIEAIDAYDRAEAIAFRIFGPAHKYTGALNALSGDVYRHLGRYPEAEKKLEKALSIYLQGSEPEPIAEGTNNLAIVKYELGKYDEALKLYQRAYELLEKTQGPNALSTALARVNVAGSYFRLGQAAVAEPLYLKSIKTMEANQTTPPGRLGDALANLANLYLEQGEMSRTVPMLQRAILLKEQQFGPDHFEVARTQTNLGAIYSKMGQFDKAQESLQRTIQILEASLGPNHVDVARALTNLAEVEMKMQKFDQAETDYSRALNIRESALGADHPDVATSLEHLSRLYQVTGRYLQATAAAERSMKIRRKKLGDDQIPIAYCLSMLGTNAIRQRKNAEAEDFLNRTLELRKKHLPPNHPEIAETYTILGWLYASTNRGEQSLELLDQSRRGIRSYVEQVLSVLSEPDQIEFLKNVDGKLFQTALSGAHQQRTQRAADLSAAWMLNSKGVAQEILGQRALVGRDATNPIVATISQALIAIRKQLATLMMTGQQSNADQARQKKIDELTVQEAEAAKKMVQLGGRPVLRRQFVELDSVRRNIADDTLLVEIAKSPLDDFQDPNRTEFPEHYLAWIIPPAGPASVKYIDLGLAEAIDAAVFATRDKLVDSLNEIRSTGEQEAEQGLKKSLQDLSKLALEPLLSGLGDCQKVSLSPDSNLWIVPWGALPLPDGAYAVEKFEFRLLITGRDLIPPERVVSKPSRPILFADPNYDLTPAEVLSATRELFKQPVGLGPVNAIPPSQNRLGVVSRLPGTKKEALAIQPKIESLANTEAYLYSDKFALEAVFKSMRQPQILVLSTHGFFLDDTATKKSSDESDNPLLRCGLLLAGCNKPADVVADGVEDGILTGLEIVSTDLRDTDLVVLSACETGLGKVQNGEGVSGLRQAFQLAGARSVVATLWQIPDRETAQLMTEFFGQLSEGTDRSSALRAAQLKMLSARRQRNDAAHPFFWAAFTITGR